MAPPSTNWQLLLATPLILTSQAITSALHAPVISHRHVPQQARVLVLSLTSAMVTPEFNGAFDSNQMDALQQRGELEASLMSRDVQETLEAPIKKSKKKGKKQSESSSKPKAPSVATFSRELKREGVVRVNQALSESTAAMLRAEVLGRRSKAYDAVGEGGEDWRQYFADVLLKSNRCDLLLPLKGSRVVQIALRELLSDSSTLSKLLTSTVGDDAVLYELATLISEPGSPRQPVHPDNPYQSEPPLLTCFVALQDIHLEMGPTYFLPKTHTAAAHHQFDDITFNDVSNRDAMLAERRNIAALLNAGDVSVFDSRTMHCGGANDISEGATRALLYVSFRNPSATESIGNVGSIMSDIKRITLGDLRSKLHSLKDDDISFDPFDE